MAQRGHVREGGKYPFARPTGPGKRLHRRMPLSAGIESRVKTEHATISGIAKIEENVVAQKKRQLSRLQPFSLQEGAQMRIEEVSIKRCHEGSIRKLVDLRLPERNDDRHGRQAPRRIEGGVPVVLHYVIELGALYGIAKLAKTGAVGGLHEV